MPKGENSFQKGHKLNQFKRTKKARPNTNTTSGRVWMADQLGTLKPGEIARAAGTITAHLPSARASKNYAALTETFAGKLLNVTTLDKMAVLLNRNMEQDKDIGGSNNAIRMGLEKIEPDNKPQQAQQINIWIDDEKVEGETKQKDGN